MREFSIFYFRDHLLTGSETHRGDLLEAIDRAGERRKGDRAEIWHDHQRQGELGLRFPR